MDWQPIESAPKYANSVWVRTAGGSEFEAFWTDNLLDEDGNDCGGWAANEGYPECWTDGVCWTSNEAGKPSDPPTHWKPSPPRSKGDDE